MAICTVPIEQFCASLGTKRNENYANKANLAALLQQGYGNASVIRNREQRFIFMASNYLHHKDQKISRRLKWYILIAVLLVMLIVFLYSKIFSGDGFYERAFYENISGISIPRTSKILESFDNGEFWTATSFRIKKESLSEFIRQFNFKKDSGTYKPQMFSETAFKSERLDSFSKKYVYNYGTKGKNSWMYIVDPERSLLWAEIQYPDWAGD